MDGEHPAETPTKTPGPTKAWTPPEPECVYLRLADFPHIHRLPIPTAYRLAIRGVLPYLRVPGTKIMLFPRERVEKIIRSWETAGGRRKAER